MNIKLNEQNPDDQINGVIKMKRERFRCQIRQTKNENLFQINRTKLSNQNLYYEEVYYFIIIGCKTNGISLGVLLIDGR